MKLLVIPPRSKWERAVAEALRVLESFCFSGFSLQALLTERCPGLLFFFPIAFVLLIAFLLNENQTIYFNTYKSYIMSPYYDMIP